MVRLFRQIHTVFYCLAATATTFHCPIIIHSGLQTDLLLCIFFFCCIGHVLRFTPFLLAKSYETPLSISRASIAGAYATNLDDRPTFFLFLAIINYLVYFMYYRASAPYKECQTWLQSCSAMRPDLILSMLLPCSPCFLYICTTILIAPLFLLHPAVYMKRVVHKEQLTWLPMFSFVMAIAMWLPALYREKRRTRWQGEKRTS